MNENQNALKPTSLLKLIMIIIGLPLMLFSCYPNGPEANEERDVVLTVFDNQADFGAIQTYAIPDSVVHIVDSSSTIPDQEPSREFDDLILQTVRDNLEARGYVRETDPENNGTDVVVVVYAVKSTSYGAYQTLPWWGYWGWWPGWGYWPGWGPGWGWWYPGSTVVFSYTTGTLLIDMLDPERREEEEKRLPSVWGAGINGILSGSSANTAVRIETRINQAFEQSPYLQKTP